MYAPLQVLSSYSLLQSPLRIPEYVKLGKELGYNALVLTDINSMYGVLLLGQRNHQPLPQSLDQLNIEKQIGIFTEIN